MPIIAIDLDNTICNYTQALRDWCHQHMDASLPCPDPTVYDFNQTPGWPWDGTTLTFQNIHEQAVNDDLYLTEQPYPHALETLRQLTNTGHQIVIATSRNDDGTDSIEWLEDHHVLYNAILHGDKTLIDADIWIDDNPYLLNRLHMSGRKAIHPAHAYCAACPGETYHDWREVPAIIDRLMSNR